MFDYNNRPDLIIDKLYLGNCYAAENLELLKELKISHILVVGNFLKQKFPREFTYKQLNINDIFTANIKQHFQENYEFIKDGITNGTGVFVHCAAGISRSSTCVIAFLMKENDLSFQKAYELVKEKHKEACPNLGFVRQLRQYETELINKLG